MRYRWFSSASATVGDSPDAVPTVLRYRLAALSRLLAGSSTGEDPLEPPSSVDVVPGVVGLAVLGLVAERSLGRYRQFRGAVLVFAVPVSRTETHL